MYQIKDTRYMYPLMSNTFWDIYTYGERRTREGNRHIDRRGAIEREPVCMFSIRYVLKYKYIGSTGGERRETSERDILSQIYTIHKYMQFTLKQYISICITNYT